VQQRILDFLYFPITFVPPEQRAEAQKEARRSTTLFPAGYVFGAGDPIFKNFTAATR